MQRKISDILPKTEILAQLAEKASKLAQSALELRRSVRMRERKVRLMAAVGQLLFHLADCMEAEQHQNEDEEVRA